MIQKNFLTKLTILLIIITLTGCLSARGGTPPTVSISSPTSGVQVRLGERVLVQSLAQAERGVAKTELWVDGRLYQVDRPDKDELTTFDVIQIWDASSMGTHTLMVKAHDIDGRVSLPASVMVEVLPPLPTPTPAPTPEATVAVNPECKPSARFVEDVTVPDDSLYNAGTRFVKTWRMRNDGECAWEPGTEWVFISESLLGATSPVPVELAEPGRMVDISVEMVAPDTPGTYRSYWRLRRPNGEFFGDQAYVRIIVP